MIASLTNAVFCMPPSLFLPAEAKTTETNHLFSVLSRAFGNRRHRCSNSPPDVFLTPLHRDRLTKKNPASAKQICLTRNNNTAGSMPHMEPISFSHSEEFKDAATRLSPIPSLYPQGLSLNQMYKQ